MGWQVVTFLMLLWIAVVAAMAVLCHRTLGTSRNLLHWLPLLVAGPLLLFFVAGIVLLFIAVLICAAIFGLVTYPFHPVATSNADGLVMAHRVGTRKRFIGWSEVQEVILTETDRAPMMYAVLRSGERLLLNISPASIQSQLSKHGIPFTIEMNGDAGDNAGLDPGKVLKVDSNLLFDRTKD